MASRVRIEDVAEAAGVSMKTVSRVLNREPNVREDTRARSRDPASDQSMSQHLWNLPHGVEGSPIPARRAALLLDQRSH